MKNIKTIGLAFILGLGVVSCSDFLDILPPNDIVLENFWTGKADVESAVLGCYTALEKPDCITRMAIWGEMRSDNIVPGMSTPESESQMLKGNILPSSALTKWTCFYQVINRCNTVLYYAPKVQALDPNYTESQLKATIAEVSAIRDLCYFYLIRTFNEVPYVTQPSIDDNQEYQIPAASFDSILTCLIDNLELVKDDAVKRYAEEDQNTGRFTRTSIHALLADMYLWKQDYTNAIKYCDLVIDSKKQQYIEEKNRTTSKIQLFKTYPLIAEQISGSYSGNAYTEIFGTGHSFESILELSFVENQSVKNSFVSSYYGSSSTTTGFISAAEFLFKDVQTDANILFKKTDCRYLEAMEDVGGVYAIEKYARLDASFNNTTSTSTSTPSVSASRRSTNYSNWILYRLTDIMLMKAESEIARAGNVKPDSINSDQLQGYRSAFSLISAVYNRANNLTATSKDTLVFGTYSLSRTAMEELVLKERQRELLFEGKRWYDLVRLARRDGNNARLINHSIIKYTDNQSVIRLKMSSPNALYFPYNDDELKVNKFLIQNPAYNTETTSSSFAD
jgi:starch-binding outer membrane protein, SusD/RagB family